MLVLKQTIPQKKALDLSCHLTPWKWVWHYHEPVTPSCPKITFFTPLLSGKPLISALLWHPESGRGIIRRAPRPLAPKAYFVEFYGRVEGFWLLAFYEISRTPLLRCQIKAEIKGFLLRDRLFQYKHWFQILNSKIVQIHLLHPVVIIQIVLKIQNLIQFNLNVQVKISKLSTLYAVCSLMHTVVDNMPTKVYED